MRVVITSSGAGLDAPASPVFGRCPAYVFVDTETMAFEAVQNPALGAASGAGIQAAQMVAQRGADAVITGNMGPNAFNVLQSAGVPIYLFGGGTVREAVEAFKAGALQPVGDGDVQAGMGMGYGLSRGLNMPPGPGTAYGQGRGTGYGMGRGMGYGLGRGMGRGRGRGMGMGYGQGRGRGMAAAGMTPPPSPAPPGPAPAGSREQEIGSLRALAEDLRRQLAAVLDQLDRLEGES